MAEKTEVTPADVRAWATEKGLITSTRGRIGADVTDAYNKAHKTKSFAGSPRIADVA